MENTFEFTFYPHDFVLGYWPQIFVYHFTPGCIDVWDYIGNMFGFIQVWDYIGGFIPGFVDVWVSIGGSTPGFIDAWGDAGDSSTQSSSGASGESTTSCGAATA